VFTAKGISREQATIMSCDATGFAARVTSTCRKAVSRRRAVGSGAFMAPPNIFTDFWTSHYAPVAPGELFLEQTKPDGLDHRSNEGCDIARRCGELFAAGGETRPADPLRFTVTPGTSQRHSRYGAVMNRTVLLQSALRAEAALIGEAQ
jgi:hypothetical protein